MKVIQTPIAELILIEPEISGDVRGLFFEFFETKRYAECGIKGPFVQDNVSRSNAGVLRGLHLQNPHGQGKLVSVLDGRVLDVAVDVRQGSPTFARHVAVELSGENRRQLWIPRGFAHGFLVMSNTADFFYKCDELYSPGDEIAIRWNDPEIGIAWSADTPILSPRDAAAPFLSDVGNLPKYEDR